MAYTFYLGDVPLPVTPSKLEVKIKNENKTVKLINEGEVNVLKLPGLTEISFEALIPQVQYPFAEKLQNATYYLNLLSKLKTEKKPFQFKVLRTKPKGQAMFGQDFKVSLEEYTITEDAKEGFDLKINIKLKQYRDYGTKILTPTENKTAGTVEVTVEEQRPAETAPEVKTYTVVSGDCLWNIAKKYLGNGSRYGEIYELNKDKIKVPNLIYPGQVLSLPEA